MNLQSGGIRDLDTGAAVLSAAVFGIAKAEQKILKMTPRAKPLTSRLSYHFLTSVE